LKPAQRIGLAGVARCAWHGNSDYSRWKMMPETRSSRRPLGVAAGLPRRRSPRTLSWLQDLAGYLRQCNPRRGLTLARLRVVTLDIRRVVGIMPENWRVLLTRGFVCWSKAWSANHAPPGSRPHRGSTCPGRRGRTHRNTTVARIDRQISLLNRVVD